MAHSAAEQIADLQANNDHQCGCPDRPSRGGVSEPCADSQDECEHEGRRQDQDLEVSCKDDPDQQAYECGEKHFTITYQGAASAQSVNARFIIAAQHEPRRLPHATKAQLDPLFPDHIPKDRLPDSRSLCSTICQQLLDLTQRMSNKQLHFTYS